MRTQKLLLILIISSSLNAFAQWDPLQHSGGSFHLMKVVEVPGHCQGELYSKTRLWFAQSLSGGIVSKNESDGMIIGTGCGSMNYGYGLTLIKAKVFYTLTIELKDDKMRYTFSNIWVKAEDGSYSRRLEEYNQKPWIRKGGSLRSSTENVKTGVVEVLQTAAKELESSVNIQPIADNW